MRSSFFFQKILTIILTVVLTLQLAGCGTLIYPERRGQTSGNIDPGIAILDAVGLFFFVVPGLVAFGIDFTTGAIYLPSQNKRSDRDKPGGMRVVHRSPAELTMESVENILAENLGYALSLNRKDLLVSQLERPEELFAKYEKLVAAGEIPE